MKLWIKHRFFDDLFISRIPYRFIVLIYFGFCAIKYCSTGKSSSGSSHIYGERKVRTLTLALFVLETSGAWLKGQRTKVRPPRTGERCEQRRRGARAPRHPRHSGGEPSYKFGVLSQAKSKGETAKSLLGCKAVPFGRLNNEPRRECRKDKSLHKQNPAYDLPVL